MQTPSGYARQFTWFLAGVLTWACLLGCRPGAKTTPDSTTDVAPLTVYCAAGIRLPVEEAAKRYEAEYGRTVRIDYGSSGELEGRLAIDKQSNKARCDLYIPADYSFADRTRQKGLTRESLPLAEFRLILAAKPDTTHNFQNVDQLLESKVPYVLCGTKAGVGKKTMATLQKTGHWQQVNRQKKAEFPRVPEAASAVRTSNDIQAGFIWDTTATQFGLKILDVVELRDAVSTVSANVVSFSHHPTAALHFARYLSAVDRGQKSFDKFGFSPVGTDTWNTKPEIVLYCGGVNRNAIDKTLREFEAREGIVVREQYGGCGTLVTGINSIANGDSRKGMPDAFMTCDTSYMEKVQRHFELPTDVSSTHVVMLVRKGNPKQIHSIKDLAKPGLAIGTTNPKMSTLGVISWKLFELEGIKTAIEQQQSVLVTTPTAHELLMQMTGHDKLDVALVYEANCQNLTDQCDIVRIDHDRAVAVQNIATARESAHPALAARLIQAIQSATSQQRFELQGFQWRVPKTP